MSKIFRIIGCILMGWLLSRSEIPFTIANMVLALTVIVILYLSGVMDNNIIKQIRRGIDE